MKYTTLKPLEPMHPEIQRQCIRAESVTVGVRLMSLHVCFPDEATGLREMTTEEAKKNLHSVGVWRKQNGPESVLPILTSEWDHKDVSLDLPHPLSYSNTCYV